MTTTPVAPSPVLQRLFRGHQEVLRAELAQARAAIDHPTLKGDASEGGWVTMLARHLPRRYRVCRGVVVDSVGGSSDQIDVIIHDAQYCPLFQEKGGTCFVPAESVYAVFEVKQEINAGYLGDAGQKVASVRRLGRTSAPILDRGREREARDVPPILGGLLALDSGWVDGLGKSFREAMKNLTLEEALDLGCVLEGGYFEKPAGASHGDLLTAGPDMALATFFVRLVHRLQKIGTVPAIDWAAYAAALTR
jgi:hypothetical protein